MHSFSYPATFRRDAKGRIVVGFPELPEAHTDGRYMAEAGAAAGPCSIVDRGQARVISHDDRAGSHEQ
jgi:hypothetical protein